MVPPTPITTFCNESCCRYRLKTDTPRRDTDYIRLAPIDGYSSTVVEGGDIPAADDGRVPGDSANVGLTAPVDSENGAINDTSCQVNDVNETASSHTPLFLCDLPDEMLQHIFGFIASSGGAAYIPAV